MNNQSNSANPEEVTSGSGGDYYAPYTRDQLIAIIYARDEEIHSLNDKREVLLQQMGAMKQLAEGIAADSQKGEQQREERHKAELQQAREAVRSEMAEDAEAQTARVVKVAVAEVREVHSAELSALQEQHAADVERERRANRELREKVALLRDEVDTANDKAAKMGDEIAQLTTNAQKDQQTARAETAKQITDLEQQINRLTRQLKEGEALLSTERAVNDTLTAECHTLKRQSYALLQSNQQLVNSLKVVEGERDDLLRRVQAPPAPSAAGYGCGDGNGSGGDRSHYIYLGLNVAVEAGKAPRIHNGGGQPSNSYYAQQPSFSSYGGDMMPIIADGEDALYATVSPQQSPQKMPPPQQGMGGVGMFKDTHLGGSSSSSSSSAPTIPTHLVITDAIEPASTHAAARIGDRLIAATVTKEYVFDEALLAEIEAVREAAEMMGAEMMGGGPADGRMVGTEENEYAGYTRFSRGGGATRSPSVGYSGGATGLTGVVPPTAPPTTRVTDGRAALRTYEQLVNELPLYSRVELLVARPVDPSAANSHHGSGKSSFVIRSLPPFSPHVAEL